MLLSPLSRSGSMRVLALLLLLLLLLSGFQSNPGPYAHPKRFLLRHEDSGRSPGLKGLGSVVNMGSNNPPRGLGTGPFQRKVAFKRPFSGFHAFFGTSRVGCLGKRAYGGTEDPPNPEPLTPKPSPLRPKP